MRLRLRVNLGHGLSSPLGLFFSPQVLPLAIYFVSRVKKVFPLSQLSQGDKCNLAFVPNVSPSCTD